MGGWTIASNRLYIILNIGYQRKNSENYSMRGVDNNKTYDGIQE